MKLLVFKEGGVQCLMDFWDSALKSYGLMGFDEAWVFMRLVSV